MANEEDEFYQVQKTTTGGTATHSGEAGNAYTGEGGGKGGSQNGIQQRERGEEGADNGKVDGKVSGIEHGALVI